MTHRRAVRAVVALLLAPVLVISAYLRAYAQGVTCVSSVCGGGAGGTSFTGGTVP